MERYTVHTAWTNSTDQFDETEWAALRSELDIPIEVPAGMFTRLHEGEWSEYRSEIIGTLSDDDPGNRLHVRNEHSLQWPETEGLHLLSVGELYKLGDDYPDYILIWRYRIFNTFSTIFLEQTWHPHRGEKISLQGLESVPRSRDAEPALRALDLLRGQKPGRARDPDFPNKYRRAIADLRAEGRKATKQEIANRLGMDVTTLYRYRREHRMV